MKGAEESTGAEGAHRQYCFAEFTLDLDEGFLRRGGEEVTLSPKAFEVLAYVVEHHGRLVTKAALIEAVWPDTAITDNSLAQRLMEIRRALSDDSQQLIRTVARRGYVFTAPVIEFPRQPAGGPAEPGPSEIPIAPTGRRALNRKVLAGALIALAVVAVGLLLVRLFPPAKHELAYTQITNFTDSAVVPALSPDGRMVAFYRSAQWFLTPDPIYVKILPDGEPVRITNDPRPKYGLSFSPDGSRIAYTVAGWNTYTVSAVGGGESRLLMSNASGLSWLDQHRLLFSEIRTGAHMGIVTATESRSDYRKIYFPQDERRMAHYSSPSPDHKWVLVVEMDPVWQPCRVVPMDGSSAGRQVGPQGKCTSAAWSPDGRWMYFGAEVLGNHHLWRQRFPSGEPEQITRGPTEEEGIAMAPDGRSLITSIGMRLGAVWIHDARGDRSVTSEGYVPPVDVSGLFGAGPSFSRDGKHLFYLNRESPGAPIKLWSTNLESGVNDHLASGSSILEYDISNDGREVVFSTQPSGKPSQLWLGALDRSSPLFKRV